MDSLIDSKKKIDKSSLIKKFIIFSVVLIPIALVYFGGSKIPSMLGDSANEVEALDVMNYSKIPDSVSQVVFLNLKVSKSYAGSISLLSNSIVLYNDTTVLLNQNIMELLDDSKNKKSMLSAHIKSLNQKVEQLSDTIEEIRMFSEEERIMRDSYENERRTGSDMFKQGLNQDDMELLSDGLEMSYKNASEYIKHRVLYIASDQILQKLTYINNLLEKKYMLLENNQDDIINHFDIIKDGDLAQRIVDIRSQLVKFQTVEKEDYE